MNWINIHLFAWILTLMLTVSQVQSSGLFQLRLKYFRNDNGRDSNGLCCSGDEDMTTGKCTGTCKTRFRVCLKHYQAKIDITSKCTFGDVVTPVLGDNSVNITTIKNFTNPIPFPFNFAWPGTFTLIVEAWHDTNQSNSRSPGVLISRLSIQRVLDVSPEWTEDKHESPNSLIQYDFRVTCNSHYYGSGCANLCRPRDDQFGHYTCSATGEIVCLAGWQGDYCSKARCLSGCDDQHGHCNKPNECQCQPGWKGVKCTECEPYPGCVHGTCKKPWECHCKEGWGGLFCNQDLNYCTNHRPCQNDGTCFNTGQGLYTCNCAPGYTGTDCEIQLSDCETSPCRNGGTCIDDNFNHTYKCECRTGWMGKHCENKTITCLDKPCNHGKCRDLKLGFKCDCPFGYTGSNCEHQIDNCNRNPCQNGGTCLNKGNSYQCLCQSGFIGNQCNENIDDCQGNPCLNGGTCIDLVNQFRCQCIPGYIGSLCDSKVDLCLTKPCANGGTCINLNNDYRCTCRPGFTGKDCSIDIDECNSNPCHNGGTCLNRVNSYQCLCPGGFRGQQCEDEAYSATFDAHQFESARNTNYDDGLTNGQVILIAIFSIAMPVIAIIAACIVICMKRKRKLAQEKDDAEARKQNEQNANANLHHHGSMISSKRSSSNGLQFDNNTNPNIIKNTWDKSVNNISNSASIDDCLMNTSLYGAMSNYSDNNTNSDCFSSLSPLKRAKSQKQLNTDPSLMHRASQIIGTNTKEYMLDSKRITVLGAEPAYCSTRWQTTSNTNNSLTTTPTTIVTQHLLPQRTICSSQHM